MNTEPLLRYLVSQIRNGTPSSQVGAISVRGGKPFAEEVVWALNILQEYSPSARRRVEREVHEIVVERLATHFQFVTRTLFVQSKALPTKAALAILLLHYASRAHIEAKMSPLHRSARMTGAVRATKTTRLFLAWFARTYSIPDEYERALQDWIATMATWREEPWVTLLCRKIAALAAPKAAGS